MYTSVSHRNIPVSTYLSKYKILIQKRDQTQS